MGRSDASDTLAKEEYKVKVDPTYVDQEGRTQLHLAVLQATDNVCVIRHMLDAGCDVTARDRMGQTPIHMASERGYVASLGCMLDLKPDLEVKDARGLTPLMVAARYGQAVALKRLLAKGAEVNACTDQSQTTLHFAAGGGHLECTDLLLFAGAKVNYTDDIKNTPLLMACRFGHVAVARRLLKSGANPKLGDDMGSCPLHWVAETGNSACAKVLIEAGACVDSVDHQGTTPFLRAIQNNTPEVLKVRTYQHNYGAKGSQCQVLYLSYTELFVSRFDSFKLQIPGSNDEIFVYLWNIDTFQIEVFDNLSI